MWRLFARLHVRLPKMLPKSDGCAKSVWSWQISQFGSFCDNWKITNVSLIILHSMTVLQYFMGTNVSWTILFNCDTCCMQSRLWVNDNCQIKTTWQVVYWIEWMIVWTRSQWMMINIMTTVSVLGQNALLWLASNHTCSCWQFLIGQRVDFL